MQLECPRCGHLLEYSQQPPRFCSNCGLPLSHAVATQPTEIVPTPTGNLDPQATIPSGGPRPRPAAEQPDAVGGYRLVRPLGGGGMGTVYEAEEAAGGRHVALKLIRPDFAESVDAVERFRREGRLASSVLHPRCVFVLAADEERGRPYIVMELMPGSNLQERVEQKGPMSVKDAVAAILDVIEGLQEAHRYGVVHRDVKPSNCFLDADGRVKVGDFGLAKSLVGPQQLTQSGAFLGTLLFASPEQIRNDHVNHLTDVYSVCATLYYLLTARAPFQDSDAAATLARTVSDPLTPMRQLRPDLPATLDEVVQRGLARSRRQRWQSLEELRLALLPFVEPAHSVDEVGWRVSAYLCDAVLLVPVELVVQRLLRLLDLDGSGGGPSGRMLVALAISVVCGMLWFAVPETLWGCTPGKLLMRLRVRNVRTLDRPSAWQSVLRTACFYLFKDGLALVLALLLVVPGVRLFPGGDVTVRMIAALTLVAVVPILSSGLGLLLLGVSMRRRNGYRGLHDWVSGTCVIRLPGLRSPFGAPVRNAWPAREPLPPGVPQRVGAFGVRAVARASAEELVLYGEDPVLARPVWLWLRRGGEPLSQRRHESARPTRARWLAGGRQDDWTWDAFVASPGCLLADLVQPHRPLACVDALSLLGQLTDELLAGSADGTLPHHLGTAQLWCTAGGQAILLDAAPREGDPAPFPLDLLRQTAALALEGVPRAEADADRPIQAPVPGPTRDLLDRLMDGEAPFSSLAEVREALTEASDQPEEIGRPARALQVALNAVTLGPGLMMMFLVGPALLMGAFILCVLARGVGEVAEQGVETHRACACALLIASPDLPGKLLAAGWLEEEQRRADDLGKILADQERSRNVVMASLSWFIRRGLPPLEERFQRLYADRFRPQMESPDDLEDDDLVMLGEEVLGGPSPLAAEALSYFGHIIAALAAWPLLWCLWDGLTRGGLGLRLAGIALLKEDGRPAARWRCALRTLLVWSPVVVLLVAALALDLWRLASGAGWTEGQVWLEGWLAWLLWWLALLALPFYAWAAVRWPSRGIHDRLAGTFPVLR
jgi:hypothetical protein